MLAIDIDEKALKTGGFDRSIYNMHPILFYSTIISTALAAPLVSWSPALGEFYAAVDRHIQTARQNGAIDSPPTCDLSQASMPAAPTPLPAPDPSWTLSEVVVGRGVQVSTLYMWLIFTLTLTIELHMRIGNDRCYTKISRSNCITLQRLLYSSQLSRYTRNASRSGTRIRSPSRSNSKP